jgi:hypothetical protein
MQTSGKWVLPEAQQVSPFRKSEDKLAPTDRSVNIAGGISGAEEDSCQEKQSITAGIKPAVMLEQC